MNDYLHHQSQPEVSTPQTVRACGQSGTQGAVELLRINPAKTGEIISLPLALLFGFFSSMSSLTGSPFLVP